MPDVVVPDLGEGGMEIAFAGWRKQVGDTVRSGEDLFEVDTGKVVVSVQAFADGVLADVRVEDGDSLERGQVVAVIRSPEDDASSGAHVRSRGEDAVERGQVPIVVHSGEHASSAFAATPAERIAHRSVMPRARGAAFRLGVDLVDVRATRADGVVTEANVRRAPGKRSARVTLAVIAAQQLPVLRVTCEVDLTGRTSTDVVPAIVAALIEKPTLNACWSSGPVEGPQLRPEVTVAVLGSRDGQPIVTATHDLHGLIWGDVADAVALAAERTTRGPLQPHDHGWHSLVVADASRWPVNRVTELLPIPHTLLVGMGRVRQVPRWDGSTFIPQPTVTVELVLDHRVHDLTSGGTLIDTFVRLLDSRRTQA